MTPLDKAYALAQKDQSNADGYYDLFLNSTIYIPVWDAPERTGERRADNNETINPVIVENDNRHYLMIFDTEERLSAWAQREIGFISVPGHAVVEMMDPKIHWMLNVGTDYLKEFVADEIQWLKDVLRQSVAQEQTIAAGTEFLIGEPAKVPPGFIDTLKVALPRNGEVSEAFLGQIMIVGRNEKPHLALVIRMGPVPQTARDAIFNDLAIASRQFIQAPDVIDIFIDDGEGVALEITKAVTPFYRREE